MASIPQLGSILKGCKCKTTFYDSFSVKILGNYMKFKNKRHLRITSKVDIQEEGGQDSRGNDFRLWRYIVMGPPTNSEISWVPGAAEGFLGFQEWQRRDK